MRGLFEALSVRVQRDRTPPRQGHLSWHSSFRPSPRGPTHLARQAASVAPSSKHAWDPSRLGSPPILWAPLPALWDHARMVSIPRMPMSWRGGKIQILGFQGCVPRRGGCSGWNGRFRPGSAFLCISECPRYAMHLWFSAVQLQCNCCFLPCVGLSVGRAARLPNTPNRSLRPPDKDQTGIDWPPMVNLKGQTGTGALPWVATSIAIFHVTTSASNSKKSYYSKVNLEQ
jgi:hypothetical protein